MLQSLSIMKQIQFITKATLQKKQCHYSAQFCSLLIQSVYNSIICVHQLWNNCKSSSAEAHFSQANLIQSVTKDARFPS